MKKLAFIIILSFVTMSNANELGQNIKIQGESYFNKANQILKDTAGCEWDLQ